MEKFILTQRECDLVIDNHVHELKKAYAYKKSLQGLHPEQILFMLSKQKWEFDPHELLVAANDRKLSKVWEDEQRELDRQRTKKEAEDLQAQWTAQNIWRFIRDTKGVKLTEHNKRFISALCYFIARDEKFETSLGYSFKKGIMVMGKAGVGKTFLINSIADNPLRQIKVYSTIEINETLREDGEINLPGGGICLDDVGTEDTTVNYYGSKISFFKEFIETYYLKKQTFSNLFASTNLNGDEIEKKYGFRVRDRVREMFNVFTLDAPESYRK